MTAAPALEVNGLEVRYGGVTALRGVTMEVRSGEIVGLIGPNGAGKSTTLHAIMGLVPVAEGEIRLSGSPLRGLPPERVARSGVALVPEGRRIFAELTVEENLQLGLAGRRSRDGAEEDIEAVYDLFPIVKEFRHRPAGALSGGSSSSSRSGGRSSRAPTCSCSTSRRSDWRRRSSTSCSRRSPRSGGAA